MRQFSWRMTVVLLLMAILTTHCGLTDQAGAILPGLASPTATQTSTPLPTSTPIPSPTPLPVEELSFGETSMFTGDYETAIADFQKVRDEAVDDELRAAGTLGIGRVYFLRASYSLAVNLLKSVIEQYPETRAAAEAWYYLAECYEALEAWPQAADAYGQYLELRPKPIAGYVQNQRGDMLMAAGKTQEAALAYQAALEDPPLGDPVWIELKLGKALIADDQLTEAATLLLKVHDNSANDYARSQANLLLGRMYAAMGETEQAYARYQDSINSFPKAYDTYTQLVELVNAGQVVDPLMRGMIDYYAQENGYCIDALGQAIKANLAPLSASYYYRGLCKRGISQIEEALADFNAAVNVSNGDAYGALAVDEAAYTLWAWLERHEQAAAALLAYISNAPDAPDAADLYFEAGRILERGGKLAQAAQVWQDMAAAYPDSEKSLQALILAGVTLYRQQDYASAQTVFQKALVLGDDPELQSQAFLWAGKSAAALGDSQTARQNWQSASGKDPMGYYSLRAAELLAGEPVFTLDVPFDLGYDLNKEKAAAENWLRSTFSLPPEAVLSGLGSLIDEQGIQRGEELYRLGRYAEAINEYETVRTAWQKDPLATYRLMNFFLERSLYRQAILSSRQILDLAGLDDTAILNAPRYFNHVRFGTYYRPLVVKAAEKENLHPLFLFSVIRQESLFESVAQSGADARGLMQILPATGSEITQQMRWPDGYTTADLNRPMINIPFGAYYMARQRDGFDGSLYAALAAYNGGPGNTAIWVRLAGDDQDLLLETIRLEETRTYIKHVYMFFKQYSLIYGNRP